jgi:hypothetical protein
MDLIFDHDDPAAVCLMNNQLIGGLKLDAVAIASEPRHQIGASFDNARPTGIVVQNLDLVDGEHFFDIVTDDVVYVYPEGDSIYIQNGLRPLYQKDRSIHIQDQLESSSSLDRRFFSQRAWESVKERKTMDAEGSRPSEWVTTVESDEETMLRRFE